MSDTPEGTGLPMLGITSDPLPMPPAMFSLLGEIVVHWSRVEGSVDQDISWMTQWPVAAALIDPKGGRPLGFKKKLELWRRATRALFPKVAVYQSYADEFKRAASLVATMRNHVIHGMWSMEPNDNGGFRVLNIRHKAAGPNVHIDELEVTREFLEMLRNDIRNLDNYITGYITSKMLHMHQGLLKVDHGPSPERPALQNPPKPSKRRRPPKSSPV